MNAVVTQESMPVMDSTERLIQAAFAQNAPIDQMERLFDLKMRADANAAKNAYVKAMAEFKRTAPRIVKDKSVSFTGTSYKHATLGGMTDAVVNGLAAHGFSHRWATEQVDGRIKVTCVITHQQGHSESTSLMASADNSGKKNDLQSLGSSLTYLSRYTLQSALGLATHDEDDDGRGSGPQQAEEVFYLDDWKALIAGAKDDETLKGVYWDAVASMKAAKNTSQLQALKDLCATKKKQFSEPAVEREPGQEG